MDPVVILESWRRLKGGLSRHGDYKDGRRAKI
jgi:hypothetical protein